MKRFLFTLFAVLAFCANAMADGVCATLQHGDEMKAYYGEDAFKSAYDDAVDGDVITLSKGKFNPVESVAKSIKIFGAYGFSNDATSATLVSSMAIDADSVHVEGIYFSGNVTLGHVLGSIIRRCYLNARLNATSSYHANTIVDQCVVKVDYAIGSSINYTIKNSTISYFGKNGSSTYKANILNNVIYNWSGFSIPYAIYKNNILGVSVSQCGSYTTNFSTRIYPYSVPRKGEFYNNLFFIAAYSTSNLYSLRLSWNVETPSANNYVGSMYDVLAITSVNDFKYPILNYVSLDVGQDGKRIGPFGGTGFTKNPAIPRITSSTISDRTDAEGKLNVSITVTTE